MASALVVFFGAVCSDSLVVKASDYTFTTSFMEPSLDEYSGYMAVNNNGKLYVYVWRVIPDNPDNTSSMNINVSTSMISFNPEISNGDSGYFTLWVLNPSGNESCAVSTAFSDTAYYKTITGLNVLGYSFRGNYLYTTSNVHSSVSVTWGENTLIYETLQLILDVVRQSQDDSLLRTVEQILLEVDNVEEALYKIRDCLNDVISHLESMETNLYNKLEAIRVVLNSHLSSLITSQNNANQYLYNIHNRLKELLNQSNEDEDKMNDFDNTSKDQVGALGSLNSQNKLDKIDIGSSSSSVDSFIDGNAIYNYGVVLSVFTNYDRILQMILIVLSIGFVSYVLFGKKR